MGLLHFLLNCLYSTHGFSHFYSPNSLPLGESERGAVGGSVANNRTMGSFSVLQLLLWSLLFLLAFCSGGEEEVKGEKM